MAISLNEALANYTQAKGQVATIKSSATQKRKNMRDNQIKTKLKETRNVIRNLESAIPTLKQDFENKEVAFKSAETFYNGLRDSEKNDPYYKDPYEAARTQFEDAESIYQTKLTELQTQQTLLTSLEEEEANYTVTEAEKEDLTVANGMVEDVIKMIASDPAVNTVLQVQIRTEYDEKIASYDAKKQDVDEKFAALEDAVKSPELDSEYKALKSAFQKFQTATGNYQKHVNYQFFLRKKDELSVKLRAKGVLDGIVIDVADYEAMAQGNFDLPTKLNEQRKVLDMQAELAAKRDAILAKVAADRFVATTGAPVIPPELQGKIDTNTQAIADATQERDDAQAKLNEITSKQARLQELENKDGAVVDTPEKQAYDAAKAAYDQKVSDLKAKGFISQYVLPELKDPTSDISKAYESFKKANGELRKAILTFEGEPTDANRDAIKTKAAEYKRIADDLKTKSGMDAEAWNKYFMRELELKAKNGETIPEEFFDDTAKLRAEEAKSENKIKDGTPNAAIFAGFMESIKDFSDLQNKIINGKNYADTDIERIAQKYNRKLNDLDAAGIPRNKILASMKKVALLVAKSIKNLWGVFKRKEVKREFKPEVKYTGITDIVTTNDDVKAALESYNNAKSAYTPVAATPLTDAEKTELADLRTKAAEETTLRQKIADKNAQLGTLTTEKTGLEAQVAALPRSAATEKPITDGDKIVANKPGSAKFLKDARKYYEGSER